MTATNPDIIIDIPADIENVVAPAPRSRPSPDATTAPGYLSLQFLVQRPRDAIAQFRKHVESFEINRTTIRCCDTHLEIERVAWISQQNQTFADLFRQAISSGLKASKTQHPGFYYYDAAVQMIKKRKLESQLTCNVPQTGVPSLMKDMMNSSLTFNSNQPYELMTQNFSWSNQQNNQAIMDPLGISQQYDQNYPINYSEAIILLLHTAIEYFKEWNCIRMEHFLSVMIADEYVESGEHHKAITIYSSALAMYKSERWLKLSKSISLKLERIMEQPISSHSDEGSRFDRMTRYEAHRCLDFRLPSVVGAIEKLSLNHNTESKSSILDLKVEAPKKVNCRQPFEIKLELNNAIDEDLGLQISIGKSEFFMFCGSKMVSNYNLYIIIFIIVDIIGILSSSFIHFLYQTNNFYSKQIHLTIPAKGYHAQNYILYPLLCGNMALPRLFLTVHPKASTDSINLDHILDKLIGDIQIMPRAVFSCDKQEDVIVTS